MRIHPIAPWLIAAAATIVLASCSNQGARNTLAPRSAQSLTTASSPTQTITIPFDAGNFNTHQPNTLFPLAPGTTWDYRQETPDGVETDHVEVTSDSKVIENVTVAVVHDVVRLNG